MFIIKGTINNQVVYYSSTEENAFCNVDVQKFDKVSTYAKVFETIEDAEEVASSLPMLNDFKIYPLCPICGRSYDGYPAISRRDNKSKVCPQCGITEALTDFFEYEKN